MESVPIYRGHIPCVRLLVAFISGLAVAYFVDSSETLYGLVRGAAILSFFAFFFFFLIGRYKKEYRVERLGIFLFLGIFFGAWTLLWKTDPTIQQPHFSNYHADVLIGVVYDEPEHMNGSIRFGLEVEKVIYQDKEQKTKGRLLVTIHTDSSRQQLYYGDVIMIPAFHQKVHPPYNPHEFDYGAYLANKGIWHTIFLASLQYKKIGEGRGNPLVRLALSFRQLMLQKFEKYIADKDALSIASALVLGYRSDMEDEIVDTFSTTGTIHVLSVSGLHVGIVFLVFSGALYWMKGNKWLRVIKSILLIVLIWTYALITGFSPSILRAAIMISFALLAFQFMRNGNIYNTIAASALFLLVYNPRFIGDIGFQLSYLAVIGIVFLYPRIKKIIRVKSKILRLLWDYTALSIAAQLATFPLVIYYFHNFPTYFLPANLFVIVPATLIVYGGFVLLLVPSGTAAFFAGSLLQTLIEFMMEVLKGFGNLPYAAFSTLWWTSWQILFVYSFLLSLIFALTLRKKWLLYGSCLCIILLLGIQLKQVIYRTGLRQVRFYNVYQHMAIALFNHDKTILYTDSLGSESKRFNYAIASDLSAMKRRERVTFLNFPSSYQSPDLIIEDNLIQFGDTRILIYTASSKNKKHLNVDILYVHGNPQGLHTMLQKIKCKQLIIDGSNSSHRIQEYIKEAASLSVPTYVLKNNFAYVW